MLAFYIDEPLSEKEQLDVLEQLSSFGEDVSLGLEFKRIPFVFPADSSSVKNEDMIQIMKGHLRNAGVPNRPSCLLVMPKEGVRWGNLLQMAFEDAVGYFPFVVQPWNGAAESGDLVRREWMRVINMNGVMSSLG
jgi:hypothetical protein